MKTTSLFVICLLAVSTSAINIDSLVDLKLLETNAKSGDAFDEVLTLLEELEQNSQGELM